MNLLSEDQIQEYREAFCIFDKKSCGFVPATDLRELLKTIGLNPTDGPTETMITEIDLDQNGLIDFGKFLNLVQRFETDEKNEKEARALFDVFDYGERGHIHSEELKKALLIVMDQLSAEEKEDAINHFQLNVKRNIDFQEFKDMITLKHENGC